MSHLCGNPILFDSRNTVSAIIKRILDARMLRCLPLSMDLVCVALLLVAKIACYVGSETATTPSTPLPSASVLEAPSDKVCSNWANCLRAVSVVALSVP